MIPLGGWTLWVNSQGRRSSLVCSTATCLQVCYERATATWKTLQGLSTWAQWSLDSAAYADETFFGSTGRMAMTAMCRGMHRARQDTQDALVIHCGQLRLQPSWLCLAAGFRWCWTREWGRRDAQLFLTLSLHRASHFVIHSSPTHFPFIIPYPFTFSTLSLPTLIPSFPISPYTVL